MSDESNPFDSPQTTSLEESLTRTFWRKPTVVEWVVIAAIVVVLIGLLWPPVQLACSGSRRYHTANNLKTIGLALHNYHDAFGQFPPAFVADESGKPLYSWRVLILPYLEQKDLYERFDLAEAWDSAANEELIREMPDVFASPYAWEKGTVGETSYLGLVDAFQGKTILRAGPSRSLDNIPDGLSTSAMVVSCPEVFAVWTEPVDLDPLEYLVAVGDYVPLEESTEWITHLRADGSVWHHAPDDANSLIPWVFCDDGRIPVE